MDTLWREFTIPSPEERREVVLTYRPPEWPGRGRTTSRMPMANGEIPALALFEL